MHIAILGGTFNPVHYGHLRMAEEVRFGVAGIDGVVFVPANAPPHKSPPGTEASLRLEMVRIATMHNPAFSVSDIEIRRGGKSFTIDTVNELFAADKRIKRISLIIGADSFNAITTWREYQKLFSLVSFIVVDRPGHITKKPSEALPVELAGGFCYDEGRGRYENPSGNTITYLLTTLMDVSSSYIRECIAGGGSARYLTSPELIDFIMEKGLYSK